MILFNYYYYIALFFIIHADYLNAFQCYECDGIFLNHSIRSDNIPPPIDHGCKIRTARHSCSVRVGWFPDGKSEIIYTSDLGLPANTINALIDRRVTTWSAEYATRRYLIYTCQPTNSTPCNTAENFERAITSTTFPTEENLEKFDTLIAPTTDFFGNTCYQESNTSDCLETNLASCQQCWGILHYSKDNSFCAMCPSGKALTNSLEYSSTFFLNNQSRSDNIKLACRKFGACNSLDNLIKIKNTLTTQFDFEQFNHSNLSSKSSIAMIVLFILSLRIFV